MGSDLTTCTLQFRHMSLVDLEQDLSEDARMVYRSLQEMDRAGEELFLSSAYQHCLKRGALMTQEAFYGTVRELDEAGLMRVAGGLA